MKKRNPSATFASPESCRVLQHLSNERAIRKSLEVRTEKLRRRHGFVRAFHCAIKRCAFCDIFGWCSFRSPFLTYFPTTPRTLSRSLPRPDCHPVHDRDRARSACSLALRRQPSRGSLPTAPCSAPETLERCFRTSSSTILFSPLFFMGTKFVVCKRSALFSKFPSFVQATRALLEGCENQEIVTALEGAC